MATCKMCGVDFASRKKGQAPKCCYSCAPFEGKRGEGPYLAEIDVPALLWCVKCDRPLPKTEFYRYRNNAPHQWCKICLRQKAVVSQHLFKMLCITYKGGSCEDCGGMPHPAAMDFHHLDSSKKEFQISKTSLKTLTDAVRGELDKCVLVCKNCHAIRHATLWEWDARDSNPEPRA